MFFYLSVGSALFSSTLPWDKRVDSYGRVGEMAESTPLLRERAPQGLRWFESSRARHVSVAQLAERRVVAAEVVESYSIRHPT